MTTLLKKKIIQNAILSASIIAGAAYIINSIPYAEAQTQFECTSQYKYYNESSYNMALKFGPLNKIFDKMGFLCRTIGRFCSGDEYDNLNQKEKQIMNVYKSDRKYGNYFPYLSKDVLNYFLCRTEVEKINNLIYDICPSILRCIYQEEVRKFCPSFKSFLLEQCQNIKNQLIY